MFLELTDTDKALLYAMLIERHGRLVAEIEGYCADRLSAVALEEVLDEVVHIQDLITRIGPFPNSMVMVTLDIDSEDLQ